MILLVAALLACLGVGLGWLATRQQRHSGLPAARIRYDDAGRRHELERPLISHRYRLTGRPDYLIEQRGALIPVELKPTRSAREPYPGDLMQLLAYCLLVEEAYGQRPPFGLLRYRDTTWRLPFDDRARAELLATLDAMEAAQQAPDVARDHHIPARCVRCSQRPACNQALA